VCHPRDWAPHLLFVAAKRLRPPAQGCRGGDYPGSVVPRAIPTPTGICHVSLPRSGYVLQPKVAARATTLGPLSRAPSPTPTVLRPPRSRSMPQSLSAVYIHLVFSTKGRRPWLRGCAQRGELHAYLGGISKTLECPTLIVGGVEDHVHLLARLGRTITQADWV